MEDFLINLVIGLSVSIGFFIFLGKSEGWFKDGGLIKEWFKNRKNKKK